MSDHESEQDGPSVWGDEVELAPPAMRTFKVILDPNTALCAMYIEAHSVTCIGDAAHFYVYRPSQLPEGKVLAAFMVRTLRPYLDIEDITAVLATTSGKMN